MMLTEQEYAAEKQVDRRTIRKLIEGNRLAAENFGTGKKKLYRIAADAVVLPEATKPIASAPPSGRRRRALVADAGPVNLFA